MGIVVSLNNALMDLVCRQIGLTCKKIIFSENLPLGDTTRNERVIRICKEIGAEVWLSNSAGRDYVEPEFYDDAGIKVLFQDFEPPVYSQQYQPFISHLSILDMLFNCGASTLEMIREARKKSPHYG